MTSNPGRPDLTKLRVLIAGDRDLQQLLVTMLQEMGISKISRAVDTVAAKAHLSRPSRRVDLVVCRLDLPKGSGLDVLKHLRETRGDNPFLLLAATATGDTIAEAQALRVNGFLAIPFSADDLKKRVTTIVTAWINQKQQAPKEDDVEAPEEDSWLI